MTIWCMRIACWIPKSTGTHLEYVILIAFPLQKWLHESHSMLRYTCTYSTLPVLLLLTADQLVGLFFFVEMPTEHSEKCLATTVIHDITNVRFVLNALT
jgi:hypothetical protein